MLGAGRPGGERASRWEGMSEQNGRDQLPSGPTRPSTPAPDGSGEVRLRVRCPECGDALLHAPDVVCRICADDERAEYRFRCPRCGRAEVVEAHPDVVLQLLVVGAPVERWTRPVEHIVDLRDDPITPDEILELHEALLDDDCVAEALAALCAGDGLPGA